jgi:hypothetical protein
MSKNSISNLDQLYPAPGFGKVGEEGGKDVAGELGVGGGHLQLLAPDAAEQVLQLVTVRHSHVHL